MARKVIVAFVALAVLVGGVAIVGSSMSSGVFNLTIGDALSSPDKLQGREFKVVGDVVAGSVKKGATPFDLDFAIADKEGRRMECHYKGAVPDPFAEGREVILQGTLDASSRMQVTKITVKCPSKYQEEGVSEDQYDDYYKGKYDRGHRTPSEK